MAQRERTDGVAALRARVLREAAVVLALTVLFGAASVRWDLPQVLTGPLEDVVLVLAFSHLLMMVFGKRRSDELKAQVDSRRLAEEELRHRARHDALTGLLNRSALVEEIDAAVAAGGEVAIALIDLDRFKEVNDTLGHHVGDALLTAVSGRLAGQLRGDAVLAPGRALEVLHRLRTLGVHLSVDDYGTGHASLAYLTRLPVGTLKIDRSFVQTMELDSSDRVIVRSTIDLAHGLGLRVVAEGVETRAAWDELVELGCDEAQGYWLARPGPAAAVPGAVDEIERRLASSGSHRAAVPAVPQTGSVIARRRRPAS